MTAAVTAIRALRNQERRALDASNWQDRMCRDLQIDTRQLADLIAQRKVKVPRRFVVGREA